MRLTGKLGIAVTVLAVAAGAMLLPGRATAQTAAAKSNRPPANAPAKAAPKAGATTKPTGTKASTKKKPAKRRTTARRQTVPTNDRIREIQAALIGHGQLTGEPSGKWDARSVEALKQFQAANSLKPTGKIDAASLQRLGLGSQTAGLAAPRRMASAESGAPQR